MRKVSLTNHGNLTTTSTLSMYGDRTMLKQPGHFILTGTGATPAAGGCGIHTTGGAGAHPITADGGIQAAWAAGFGHPVIYGHPHGLCGCMMTITAGVILFRPGCDAMTTTTAAIMGGSG